MPDAGRGYSRHRALGAQVDHAAQLAGFGPQAVVGVGLYDGIDYTGATYTFYVTAPCTSPHEGEYGNPNLGTFSNGPARSASRSDPAQRSTTAALRGRPIPG